MTEPDDRKCVIWARHDLSFALFIIATSFKREGDMALTHIGKVREAVYCVCELPGYEDEEFLLMPYIREAAKAGDRGCHGAGVESERRRNPRGSISRRSMTPAF